MLKPIQFLDPANAGFNAGFVTELMGSSNMSTPSYISFISNRNLIVFLAFLFLVIMDS